MRRLIDANAEEFERFPSFVAAKIADYDKSEIGSGGPYDLCAAGRYWYWDAVFRESQQAERDAAGSTEDSRSGRREK